MRLLFTFTIFVGSALLFLVEPMVAKLILPKFGGAPAVWTAAMVFFQVALLIGYGYADLAVKWLGPKRQSVVHVLLALVGLLLLPISLPSGTSVNGSAVPALSVLATLFVMVGVPFILLAAGAPLVQRWFAHTDDPHAKDPYFLYSASNLGSMVALIAYPLVVEPNLGLAEQSRLWKIGYVILAVLLAVSAVFLWRSKETVAEADLERGAPDTNDQGGRSTVPTWQRRVRWVVLAAIPSSLLLSVTTHATTVIAPVPLMWVLPLVLYLLTFIIAFAKHPLLGSVPLSWTALLLSGPLCISLLMASNTVPVGQLVIHLGGFFFLAWACHRTLAEDRPSASRLTEFFFFIALGGVVGGIFNSLVAPLVFKSMAEYPIAVVIAAFLLPRGNGVKFRPLDLVWVVAVGTVAVLLFNRELAHHRYPFDEAKLEILGLPIVMAMLMIWRPFAYAASLAAICILANFTNVASGGLMVNSDRSFFGVHDVVVHGTEHELVHGTTLHGIQDMDEKLRYEPVTYYARTGPIGQLMAVKSLGGQKPPTAVVGLGAGTMAAYGQPGQTFDFYEIDPTVVKMARNPNLFTYVTDCKANLQIKVGDARLSLQEAASGEYEVIVLDAFSSDAIPVHLLTSEAIELYLSKLAPTGVIAFHISNRYLDLRPVLANACRDLGLVAICDTDIAGKDEPLKLNSMWVMVGRRTSDFGSLATSRAWVVPATDPHMPTWTDDRSSVLGALLKSIPR